MKSEKDLIRSKYENAYPNLFQNMTDSLDNESMAYGDYLNKNTKYKQGSTPQLVSKMWDVDGLSIEYNKYVNLHGFTPVVSSRLNSRVQAALAPNLLSPAARYIS